MVVEAGASPIYGDFREPVPAEGEIPVKVTAGRALSNVVRSRRPARTIARPDSFLRRRD